MWTRFESSQFQIVDTGVLHKKLRIKPEQERDSRYFDLSSNLLASAPHKKNPYPFAQAVQSVLDFIAPEDAEPKSLDPKSFAQDCFLTELDENVFIKAL